MQTWGVSQIQSHMWYHLLHLLLHLSYDFSCSDWSHMHLQYKHHFLFPQVLCVKPLLFSSVDTRGISYTKKHIRSCKLNIYMTGFEIAHLPRTIINTYLEIPILIKWSNIIGEGKLILKCNLPRFYSYL